MSIRKFNPNRRSLLAALVKHARGTVCAFEHEVAIGTELQFCRQTAGGGSVATLRTFEQALVDGRDRRIQRWQRGNDGLRHGSGIVCGPGRSGLCRRRLVTGDGDGLAAIPEYASRCQIRRSFGPCVRCSGLPVTKQESDAGPDSKQYQRD